MRVLFVEDNRMNRRVIAEMLRAGGVEMDEAEDGPSGLAMIDANAYDLVLMDLRMPGMDGLTAIREIRTRTDAKARLPVIVVTADSGTTLEADCQAAGADDVIRKPVDLSTLFTTIGDLIARRGEGGLVLS
ncbi:response regulator [Caulobacter sp. Root1455]|uniref:response regulator n=1 Tax=Caulobacter sp. Root1455 TaxID=1736465 RepID=UPI0006F7616E|nr:response regulator [Caulobacter sp. Root1455]KQZ06176.1 response regulator [Caulobacter sp. Root1455]